ncbi:SdrD B-like domain-containing protein [Rhodovulum sp. ES.010]|uniref:SdrD B-like domain-containing protein n=1 Tax=Rhodovulum sp. ES.010 TaxID=1882821 RepID=UPI000940EF2F|nr:SdrD B-like domain-containing protein [Rhodovulum sp. ES.010]
MTYYYGGYSYDKTYEFTAFSEHQLLSQGGLGSDVGCGDSFTMPAHADTCIEVTDNDRYLSGDWCDHATDRYGQTATITKGGAAAGSGGQIYAESYYWVTDQHGNWYLMIEIEQEGTSGDYFTFHSGYGMPPAGAELTIRSECDVSGNWVDYACLDAGPKEDPNTAPGFDNVPDSGEICIDENTAAVIDLDASDSDGDSLTYSIAGGADGGLFEIDAHSGELRFKAAPDYEAPADHGADNVYEVKVKVSDGRGGEEVKLLKVCVDDVDEGGPGGTCTVIEAEDMRLWGYEVEHRGDASDGAGIALCTSKGYASTSFTGESGTYDLNLRLIDESDGKGAIQVYVNGCKIETIWLNRDDGGNGLDGSSTWTTVSLEDVSLAHGDRITLKGYGDCAEYARIDKIEICEPACAPCVTIEAEDMYAYNYKTVCGVQASGNELVRLKSGWCGIEDGKLKTVFKGCDGTYDLKIFAQDEDDGQSTVVVKVNGVEVGTILLNEDDDGSGNDNGGFSEFTLENVEINAGDEIALYAHSDGGEYVRIDKIELCRDEEPKLGAIGDTVWFDADGDGLQDAGEAGVANVTVSLLDGSGTVVATQTTDGNGNYLFEDLAAGDYQVVFELPAGGFAFTAPDNETGPDGDAGDSDADASGATGVFSLAEGEVNLTVDAGIVDLPGSLSGRYFIDADGNGLDDDGVNGVEGVTVELLDAAGGPTGITTTTGATGGYSFTGLAPGTYGVKFTDTVTGLALTAPNVGEDDTIDSDATDLGAGMSQITGIVVTAGADTPDNDAGVTDPETASLGDTVWIDANRNGLQDAGEAGLAGVAVTLLNGDGTATGRTAVTDGAGKYLFAGLAAGTYLVDFAAADGFDFTAQDSGDDALDSDVDATGLTGPIVLGIGEENLTVDAGVISENPIADDDAGKVCATEATVIDVLDGDSSPTPGATLSVAHVAGVEVAAGDSVTLASGATVTLNADGTLSYDSAGATYGGIAAADLLIRTTASDSFTYSIGDGLDGTATATVDVTICGAKNTLETISASLPGAIDFRIDTLAETPLIEGYTVTLSGSGDARLDGNTFAEAYCLASDDAIVRDVDVAANVYVATEALAAGSSLDTDALEDLDLITWILNQDFGAQDNGDGTGETYTETEIQAAIWHFTDQTTFIPAGTGTQANAQEIIALAEANGEGFTAGEGDIVGLVLDPVIPSDTGHVQPFIIGIGFDLLAEDCFCL